MSPRHLHSRPLPWLALGLVVALAPSHSFAQEVRSAPALTTVAAAGDGHSGGRNGDDHPDLAYDRTALEKIEKSFNLDFLKLEPAEVEARRQRLEGVLQDYYHDATIERMKDLIEKTFGVRLFHLMKPAKIGAASWATEIQPAKKKPTPEELQAQAELTKKQSAETEEILRTQGIVQYYLDYNLQGSYFEKALDRAVPFRGILKYDTTAQIQMQQVAGPDRVCPPKTRYSSDCQGWQTDNWQPFVFATEMMSTTTTFDAWRFHGETTAAAVFETTRAQLFQAPVLISFADAMSASGLKTLDAEIVFIGGALSVRGKAVPYYVVYPQNDRTAPVPRPIIYIGAHATKDDLVQMLTENAGQVFAYNKMFEAKALPSIVDLDTELKKCAAEDKEIAALIQKVGIENARNALHATYLKVTYGILAGILAPAEFVGRAAVGIVGAPLAVGSALSRPVLREVFINHVNDQIESH